MNKQIKASEEYQEACNYQMTIKTIQKQELADYDKTDLESHQNFRLGCSQVDEQDLEAGLACLIGKCNKFNIAYPDPEELYTSDQNSKVLIKGVKAPTPLVSLLKNAFKYCKQISELLF